MVPKFLHGTLQEVFPKQDGKEQLGVDWVTEGNLAAGETALLMLTNKPHPVLTTSTCARRMALRSLP
ncbi:hypothetical protein LEMLEM_LOCUS25946 [Lemmus lemmus]